MFTGKQNFLFLLNPESNIYQIKIPSLQRNYVWDEKKIEKLISDLNGNDTKAYFLGNLILRKTYDKNEKKYLLEVIDGQQRIATIATFLILFDKFLSHNKEFLEKTETQTKQMEAFLEKINFIDSGMKDSFDKMIKTKNFDETENSAKYWNLMTKVMMSLLNVDKKEDIFEPENFEVLNKIYSEIVNGIYFSVISLEEHEQEWSFEEPNTNGFEFCHLIIGIINISFF